MASKDKIMSSTFKGVDITKYLPNDMKKEYDRLTKLYPDVPDLVHPYINISDALRGYFILADYFTDDSSGDDIERMLVGIRDMNLLISALCRQNVSYAGVVKYSNPLDVCATLFFGLVKNHAFSDGNKRTALLMLLYQLLLYGYLPSAPTTSFEKLVVAVAANQLHEHNDFRGIYKKFKKSADPEIKTISYWLRHGNVKKKDHSYHVSPSAKEFCAALKAAGVSYTQCSGKLKFERNIKTSFFPNTKSLSYTIPFGGWTRIIGAKTARDVLEALKLYEQYANYADILHGVEPLYEIIDKFSVPLRRLKDE